MGCTPMDDQDIGTLYVLANQDHSLAKIGLTRNGTPDARADAYARDHGIRWHVYWSARTRDVAAAEASAHRDLQGQRFALVPDAREIFHVTPQKARRVCERLRPRARQRCTARTADRAAAVALAPRGITAAVLLIVTCWAALRRLHRTLRRLRAALH